jgi:hypothetical protein
VVAFLRRLIHGSIREVKPSAPSSRGGRGGSIARQARRPEPLPCDRRGAIGNGLPAAMAD